MNTKINACGGSPLTYEEYLLQNDYSKTTIKHNLISVAKFTKWLQRKRLNAIEIDYKDSLTYIKHLQGKKISVRTINIELTNLRKYFNYLIEINQRTQSPIEDVTVKGAVKRVLHNLLEADELEDLYYSYETESFNKYANINAKHSAKRNKIIIGLLVYQGLNTTNLKSLLVEHLELYKGKIYIPSTRRSNSRTMELKSWQVLDLLEYINEIRPKITKKNNLDPPDGEAGSEQLFIPQNSFNDLVRIGIFRRLKKINYKVVNVHHLRASVIVNWLGQYNLRKVQYLAGHKYISSTEKYKQNNLENLHEAINEFHPLS